MKNTPSKKPAPKAPAKPVTKPAATKAATKKSNPLMVPAEKNIPEETRLARKKQSDLAKFRTYRELKVSLIGSNTNSNLGGQADTSGYSPYVLS